VLLDRPGGKKMQRSAGARAWSATSMRPRVEQLALTVFTNSASGEPKLFGAGDAADAWNR
jgi:hypothetical protein